MRILTTTELPFKRRMELKTNYAKRLAMIKSGKPRLAIRKSDKYIAAQIISHAKEGDRTEVTAFSRELKKLGWTYSVKNLPAAYLTGLLCGTRAKSKGINEAILDIGLYTPVLGSRLFAAAKGAIDAGLSVKVSEEAMPKEERIKGAHISKDVEKAFDEMKGKILKEMNKNAR